MRKIYPQSCRALLLLILCFDIASAAKKGSYSVPLRRTKRDLRDSRGNPTVEVDLVTEKGIRISPLLKIFNYC